MVSKPSVLITGCSDGGIGSALALAFSKHGSSVFATARKVENMSELHNRVNITLLPLDILSQEQIKDTVQVVLAATGGKLEYLFSNAGRNRFMPLLDEDVEAAKKLYDTNVWGPLQLVQAFSPLLIQAKGTIVLNTSVSGYLNVPWQGVYAASKRSLEVLGDNLRLELAPFDVKVISIVTGAVATKGHSHYREWQMPESSRYLSIVESFTKRAKGEDGAPRMNIHTYAEGVVAKLLGNPGPKFWYGAAVGLVKFATAWFPTSWMDMGVAKGTGIDIMLSAKS